MTIGTFEQLTEDDKLRALLTNGSVISERKNTPYRSFLYYLGSFYVAVEYGETDDLKSIKAFKRIEREQRIEWKVLRVPSEPRYFSHSDPEGFL